MNDATPVGAADAAGAACPACRCPEATLFVAAPVDREYYARRAVSAEILRCDACRSLYQEPWPTAAEVQGFYGADYQNYTTTAVPLLAGVNAFYQRQLSAAFLREFGANPAVLDFGCGQGGFLRELAAAGCRRLAGFDFVLYPELGTITGARFFDDLDEIHRSGLRFDVIRLRHVIEHLTDVDATLGKLTALLTPTGRIIGQTPNAAHYTARLMGSYWGPLHFPYHTVLFSPEGLRRTAARSGLVLRKTTGSVLPTGWAMSGENFLKQVTGSRRRGRTAVYTLLMAASLPLAVLDRLLAPAATANFDFELSRP